MADARRRITDSPWFWAYVFATAGLIALALAAPKYRLRQTQIERQFEGRQNSMRGTANAPADEPPPVGKTRITLQPLFLGLAAITMVAWFVFLRTHLARREAPS